MTKPNNFKNDSMSRDKETKKSTKKTGVSTSINAAAILDILERFSGYIKNGEMVKLRLETPAKSLDRSLGIKELLKNQYGISLKVDTIRNNLIGLQSLFDKIKRNRNYYYWTDARISYRINCKYSLRILIITKTENRCTLCVAVFFYVRTWLD